MVGKEALYPEAKNHDNMPLGQEDCRTLYRELKSRGLEIPHRVEQAMEDDPKAATDYLDSMRYFLDTDNYRQIEADWKRRANLCHNLSSPGYWSWSDFRGASSALS